MKNLLYAIAALIFIFSCTQNEVAEDHAAEKDEHKYDSTRAARLGADNYGMKTYVMAFLKTGPNRPEDSIESVRLQSAHLANISRLAKEGKLVLAGPFYGNDSLRGIYIFNTDNIEEARQMTETDPAIQQGSLAMELKLWYGSAALVEINGIHKKIAKSSI